MEERCKILEESVTKLQSEHQNELVAGRSKQDTLLAQKNTTIVKLEEEIARINGAVQSLTDDLAHKETHSKSLAAENAELKNNLDQETEDKKKLRADLVLQSKKYEECDTRKNVMEAETTKAKSEATEAQNLVVHLHKELEQLTLNKVSHT